MNTMSGGFGLGYRGRKSVRLTQSSAVHAPQMIARSEIARPIATSRGTNTTPAEAFPLWTNSECSAVMVWTSWVTNNLPSAAAQARISRSGLPPRPTSATVRTSIWGWARRRPRRIRWSTSSSKRSLCVVTGERLVHQLGEIGGRRSAPGRGREGGTPQPLELPVRHPHHRGEPSSRR